MVTLIGGHAFSALLFIGPKSGMLPSIHFTLVAGLVFGVSTVLYFATRGWGIARSEEEIATLMVQPAPPAQPGLASYKVQSAVLLALTAALVGSFH